MGDNAVPPPLPLPPPSEEISQCCPTLQENNIRVQPNRCSSIQNQVVSVLNHQSHVYLIENHIRNVNRNLFEEGGQFLGDQLSQISSNIQCYNSNENLSQLLENYYLNLARTQQGAKELQEVLKKGNYSVVQEVLKGVLGSIFQLMIDDNGHHVFGMLIEKCQNDQLFSIVNEVRNKADTFIHIAFTDKGSRSIQRLIKRLKRNPPMAKIITSILSKESYHLLTHKTGSHVVRQCFIIFGEESNLVLYEAISSILLHLAVDPVGCISLNNILDTVTGKVRGEILYYLADHSLFLANDPSGNFVVQHMLNLNNDKLTEKILNHLKGNFGQLAQKKGGSHVVEKCMCSEYGLKQVVSEIIRDGKELFRVARDQFGNYVIQAALKQTKMMISDKTLYYQLLTALKPYYPHLQGKTKGRHVAELIKEDLEADKSQH
ncbi:hypothetical protein M9H77_24366 [Catharanthus roseus]|uniref:Uncharacterized protein n=1 Tax=Catharanthus roseus TaxID=4058 RepID=A0ACC0AYP9_CATRO|nr:hypothetical protein M9H77_24366 [Catharanthus roseus]